MKNCIRSPYEKLKPLKSGFIENSNFENIETPVICIAEYHSSCYSVLYIIPPVTSCFIPFY